MKKNKFMFLLALILFVTMPFSVDAETFNRSNAIYNMEKVNTSCVSNYINDAHAVALIDGKILFTDKYDESYVFLKKDGTCDTNVTMNDVIEGRKKLGYIHTDAKEENGKYYAVTVKYSIPVSQFVTKDTDETIQVSHYDKETLEDGLTCYKRENINGIDYVTSFKCSHGNENEIFSYYYDKSSNPKDYQIIEEIIGEIDEDTYDVYERFPYGYFVKQPRGDNIFYLTYNDEGEFMMYSPAVNASILRDADNAVVLSEYLFLSLENNVAKITDSSKDYISYDNVTWIEYITSDNFYDLMKMTDTNGSDKIYLLSRYEVDDCQDEYYDYADGDYIIKYSNDLTGIKSIKVNDIDLDIANYTINNKTGELTLKESFMDTLSQEENTLSIIYDNGIKIDYNFMVPITIDIILNANGGIFDDDTDTKNITFKDDYDAIPEPTREGYTFDGWYNENNQSIYFGVVLNDGMTIYAHWKENSAETKPAESEEENPKTFDGIGTSVFMGTISLIGLIGTTIYLKKEIK